MLSIFHPLQPRDVKKGEIFRVNLISDVLEKPQAPLSILKPQAPPSILKRRIKVRAPKDLKEGFEFSTVVKGITIKSIIPKGGVKKGEIFTVPYIPTYMNM